MVLLVKDNNSLVSLEFEEEKAHGGRQGHYKISKLITFNCHNSRPCHMAEILPIQYPSINLLPIIWQRTGHCLESNSKQKKAM